MALKPGGRQVIHSSCVLGAAIALALISARPFAGGWNDGSRLATVECLVDYHTLAIDQSVFVRLPTAPEAQQALPYPPDDPELLLRGTGDKLYIDGHFYSDKSPTPAIFLAGVYQVYQWCTGYTAAKHADLFCYWMTVASAGLAYVVAVWCIYQLAGCLGLPASVQLLLTASFALATVAPAYARHVNNHMMLLALFAALMLGLVRLAEQVEAGTVSLPRLIYLGTLLGLAHAVDTGAGPVVFLITLILAVYRCRKATRALVMMLAALPWICLHHALNYAVGGTLRPANAVIAYFAWPGCTFNAQNMTGVWHHAGVGDFLLYGMDMLAGRRGFVGHNLPLYLAVLATPILWRRRFKEFPELIWALCCCGGIWLLYAVCSNNYSGQCCSIRWFVPLLAPAYGILALLLRECRRFVLPFAILSILGMVAGSYMWSAGPWMKHMVPLYWLWQCAAGLTLVVTARAPKRVDALHRPPTVEDELRAEAA